MEVDLKKMEDDLKKFIKRQPIKIKIKGKTNSKKKWRTTS